MVRVDRWLGVGLMAAIAIATLVAACGGTTVVDGGAASGGGGEGAGVGGSTDDVVASSTSSSMPPRCDTLSETACDAAPECVALFDWLDVMMGSPPPPPVPPSPNMDPCCPECMTPSCSGCHVPTFTACVALADCGSPPPNGLCGFPKDDCPL